MTDYPAIIRQCLMIEADAISRMAHALDSTTSQHAFALIHGCAGKVIAIGVGKSGIVARKIAATMNSTGTAATFLHAGDALHGDLGVVERGDVAIVISNSGETDEIVAMLPHLKQREVPIVAIVGNSRSTVARHADAALVAVVEREACPLGVAPTTSTTLALALGDALAMAVMQAKGITRDAFARNHPAGQLGKRLTIRVRDLAHCGPACPSIGPSTPWLDVLRAMTMGGLGGVTVIEQHKLVGLITDGDLRRVLQRVQPSELADLTASSFMTANPITIAPDCLAYDALRIMEDRESQISVLPVVQADHEIVGLLRLHDIIGRGI
jgi:arabinose-5-phosphate isomerase